MQTNRTPTVSADEILRGVASVAEQVMDDTGVPGVAVGVVSGTDMAATGLGTTHVQHGRAVTPETLFRACQITQSFTASVVLSLVEAGRLHLDEPVVTYLPDLELADADALSVLSLRHLLTHTGGFECELPVPPARYGSGDDALDRMVPDFAILRQWARPGTVWGYCNTGYWLAGAVVARCEDQPFESVLQSRLLDPLGLTRTCVFADDAILHPVALPHRAASSDSTAHTPAASFALPRGSVPSGGVISSVSDLLTFAAFHLGQHRAELPALSEELLSEMRRPFIRSGLGDQWQGLGWPMTRVRDTWVIEHTGAYVGYETLLAMFPETQTAVVALTNSDLGYRVTYAVRDEAIRLITGAHPHSPNPIDVPEPTLARLAGSYELSEVEWLTFAPERGGLRARFAWQERPDVEVDALFRPVSTGPEGMSFVVTEGDLTWLRLEFLDDTSAGRLIRFDGRLGRPVPRAV
jgi:CubicO group peptidase (beta-lactamase class C family)